MMLVKGMLLLAVGLFATEDQKDAPTAKALQGKWNVVSGEEGGKKLSDTDVKEASVIFAGNRVRVRKEGKDLEMTYELKEKGKQGEIDFTLLSGPDKGKTSRGIYALEGDRLSVCYAPAGEERPRTFSTRSGGKDTCWVLRRAEKSEK